MQLLAILLTTNSALISAATHADSEISPCILRKAGCDSLDHIDIKSFDPKQHVYRFSDFLGETIGLVENRLTSPRYHGILVLYESRVTQEIDDVRDSIFSTSFDETYIENPKNFLIAMFGQLAKNFITFSRLISTKHNMEATILPTHNFESKAFLNFLALCMEPGKAENFHNQLVPALAAVTGLRGPKRRSKYPTKYFKDDRCLFFQYGYEIHSSFETGGEHTASCTIRGHYRFGTLIDSKHHFNVTEAADGQLLSRDFTNCHGKIVHVSKRTHVNMFSNDFLK